MSSRLARIAIAAAFIVLGILYSFATPIFEKNDEESHAWFAYHLATGGDLPVQVPGQPESALQREGSQPPLYYWLASAVMGRFDLSDFWVQQQPNQSPSFSPYAPSNKNLLIITPQKRAFNYVKTTLAALVLRLLGLIPGVIAVWFVYPLAFAVSRDERLALLAMGLTAFNPMFIQVMTALGNDGLVIALATVALYAIVRGVLDGFTWQRVLAAGILIALASLSKVSGTLLLPVAALAILGRELIRPSSDSFARRGAAVVAQGLGVLGVWVLIAGWWYWRNVQLYGDFTGTSVMAQMMTPRNFTLAQALSEWQGFRMSYIAMFGQFAVPADDIVYTGFDILLVVSGIGLLIGLARAALSRFAPSGLPSLRRVRTSPPDLAIRQEQGETSDLSSEPLRALGISLLALYVSLMLVSVLRWTMMTPASHGRLIFPGIAAVSTLMAIGWMQWADLAQSLRLSAGRLLLAPSGPPGPRLTPQSAPDLAIRREHQAVHAQPNAPPKATRSSRLPFGAIGASLVVIPLFIVAAIAPFRYIRPGYEPPLVSQAPPDLTPVQQHMGDLAEVLGYRMTPQDVRPGDKVRVTVAMRALRAERDNYSLVTKLYGRDGVQLARFDTFTGKGLWPSMLWRPGDLFLDEVELTVPMSATAPGILRVQFELYNAGSGDIQQSADAAGRPGAPLYHGATLLPTQVSPVDLSDSTAQFGDLAILRSYELSPVNAGQPLTLTLDWNALTRASRDFTVFAQLLAEDGQVVAQHDKQPLDGQFPTTRWEAGARFTDRHVFRLPPDLPPGTYAIALGFYDVGTGERLPVTAGGALGQATTSPDALVIGGITVQQ